MHPCPRQLSYLTLSSFCVRVFRSYVKGLWWFSCAVVSDSTIPWTAAHQASLPFIISSSLPKLMSTESVKPPNHLILYYPLLLLPSVFLITKVFSVKQLFASGGQSIGASASVLLKNIQGLFPLGLTGLISLQTKKLSRVFSNTVVQKHQFFHD